MGTSYLYVVQKSTLDHAIEPLRLCAQQAIHHLPRGRRGRDYRDRGPDARCIEGSQICPGPRAKALTGLDFIGGPCLGTESELNAEWRCEVDAGIQQFQDRRISGKGKLEIFDHGLMLHIGGPAVAAQGWGDFHDGGIHPGIRDETVGKSGVAYHGGDLETVQALPGIDRIVGLVPAGVGIHIAASVSRLGGAHGDERAEGVEGRLGAGVAVEVSTDHEVVRGPDIAGEVIVFDS